MLKDELRSEKVAGIGFRTGVRLPSPPPRKKSLLSTDKGDFFQLYPFPAVTDDIADAMISASQMIYASRMVGTDIISYFHEV